MALDNLVDKMETKVEANILFTQRALDEIKQLMVAVGARFTDVKGYYMTKNPLLKAQIQAHMEKIGKIEDVIERVPVRQTIVECGNPKMRRKV